MPEGIRTPDPRLRRAMLYPTELLAHALERVMGIEPTWPAWKAGTLPLSYTRTATDIFRVFKTQYYDSIITNCCQQKI